MNQIDEFESRFKSAERTRFAYADIPIESVAVVTDTDPAASKHLRSTLQDFLPRIRLAENWRYLTGDSYSNVGELLGLVDAEQTDLIVTYRHLQEESLVPKHSLGVYLDVLTQTTSIPVLVLPGTAAEPVELDNRICKRVMVVTDHISGDNRLINYGARMCDNGGSIWLCHIEDEAVFERYMHTIGQIPEIDTDQARVLIECQLLKNATDFIDNCIEGLRAIGPNISCHAVVERGHHLQEYRALIDEHNVDLLVANTKDEDQLAMHGITYSLSVELTNVAMLLL